MPSRATNAIDIVEAAYDLDLPIPQWLPNLMDSSGPLFDFGLGYGAALWSGATETGEPLITQMVVPPEHADFPIRFTLAAQEAGPEVVAQTSNAHAGGISLLSEMRDKWPTAYDALTKHVGCKDIVTLFAVDPDLYGALITVPSPTLLQLRPREREQLQMLAVHIAAGRRLRRSLGETSPAGVAATEIPLAAEALLDPSRFVVAEAVGSARDAAVSESLREAAIRADKARGKLRRSDPAAALELWTGLVKGRWSLVDWFDTDGRRFVLAKPNAPNCGDPRGLSEQQAHVATYAALGETQKQISYRFGLSRPRVSALLKVAMRKLGAKTQAQLVEKMRGMPGATSDEDPVS